jgi:CubicO group peptidase (beta-lactamase class C family)
LFGTARAVATLAEGCLFATLGDRRARGLPGQALRSLWAHRGVGSHCHGWDTVSRTGYSAAGLSFPDDTRGHLGYTGTSVWVVPSWRASIACLTNRVHPVDDKDAIRAARPRIHDAIARHLGHAAGA